MPPGGCIPIQHFIEQHDGFSRLWYELSMPWFAINLLFLGKCLQASPFQTAQSAGMHPAVHPKNKPCWQYKLWDACPIIGKSFFPQFSLV